MFAKTIVITRPSAQAISLATKIEQFGGIPLIYPLLEIKPVVLTAQQNDQLAQLYQGGFHALVFVSPNAVEQAASHLPKKLLPSLQCIAIGEGTARAIEQTPLFSELKINVPVDRFDSEGVLGLEILQKNKIENQAILIFRGQEGRTLLGQTLTERGAHVEYFTCYERFCPMENDNFLYQKYKEKKLDGIVITSSESLRAFESRLSESHQIIFKNIPIFMPHPRIVTLAENYHYQKIIQTPPLDEGILTGLLSYFS